MAKLRSKHVILTGAAGGIGSLLAKKLVAEGACVSMVDLNKDALQRLQKTLGSRNTHCIAANITSHTERQKIIDESLERFAGIDILINVAGINPFGSYTAQSPELIQRTMEINTIAPMMLAHGVLPAMMKQGSGQIVNIGSTFGSIGFAWFSTYSTSKFALRGFSQSLRRELAGSGIDVSYIAPRAVKTAINSQAVYDMAKVVKMKMDEPEHVASEILKAIRQRKKEHYIGFPESFFARLNAVLPGIVDLALRKQNRVASRYIETSSEGMAHAESGSSRAVVRESLHCVK